MPFLLYYKQIIRDGNHMTLELEVREELKMKLMEEKSRLEGELSRFADPTNEPGEYKTRHEDLGTDPDENATEVEEYVDNLGLETSLEEQLQDVLHALGKMEDGTYGDCEKDGEPIAIERLRAYPAARTCVAHAE